MKVISPLSSCATLCTSYNTTAGVQSVFRDHHFENQGSPLSSTNFSKDTKDTKNACDQLRSQLDKIARDVPIARKLCPRAPLPGPYCVSMAKSSRWTCVKHIDYNVFVGFCHPHNQHDVRMLERVLQVATSSALPSSFVIDFHLVVCGRVSRAARAHVRTYVHTHDSTCRIPLDRCLQRQRVTSVTGFQEVDVRIVADDRSVLLPGKLIPFVRSGIASARHHAPL